MERSETVGGRCIPIPVVMAQLIGIHGSINIDWIHSLSLPAVTK